MIIEKEVTIQSKEKLSDYCKDLILKMLGKDPNKRVNLSQVLEHPWIQNYREGKRQLEWGLLFASDSDIEEESALDQIETDRQHQDKNNQIPGNQDNTITEQYPISLK